MAHLSWTNLLFIVCAHLLALTAILGSFWSALRPGRSASGACGSRCAASSITGGYHRLFAHPTYRASRALRAFYLLFGAASVQNSALKWASDHRTHHAQTDRDQDPYNIRRGFWWAHIGWVFFKDPDQRPMRNVKDLAADPLVRWQDRHYVLLAIVFAGVVPLLPRVALGRPARRAAGRRLPAPRAAVARDLRGQLLRALDRHASPTRERTRRATAPGRP